MKMPINDYFIQKDKNQSTLSIKHQDLFRYIVSSEINQNIGVEALNTCCMAFPWTCLRLFFASTKSNDNTNIFEKSILYRNLRTFTLAYDIIKSPEHF